MVTKKAPRVKIRTKPSLKETLRALPLNEPQRFSIYDFKVQAARQAVSDLRKRGFEFEITERDLVNEYIVTRLI